ncbi:S8 family serine peptidase [Paucibacter sediminis]|uniref:S8 family serine peptidase n=1 Tax=Paucibacter sediminis TaxID=3019553 RepID=A0AA95NGB3_9BURK|nr:S8 family serine peptidase [Paucibacter sp. S2-9]WIT13018.1 S8 family serine peptidase [Paucibacter sp. S2-9]
MQHRSASSPLMRLAPIVLAWTACMPALAASTAAGNAAMPAAFAPGRVLIGTRAGLSDEALAALLAPHGAKARRLGRGALHLVELPAGASASAVRDQLARHPLLKFAELDRMVPAALTTNDPYLGSEWHLTKVGASTAWDSSQGSGVTIAVLDTGVDATHPDLATRIVPGWNFVDNSANTADVNGHGTAVAGAATASLNNSLGVAGLAGQARLMPVRIADANAYTYWSTLAQGLTWAADQGARVANISFVGVATSQAVQDAANYMRSKGGLVVVAAGNNGVDEGIAPTSSMLVVSATDSTDTKTSWSSYGSFVTISAPGQDIWTTTRGGGYQAWWGTSMATPVVAGVIGLMMSAQPSLSNSKVESLLYSTSTDLGAAGRDSYYGYGRVNAAAAVRAAVSATAADTLAPSVSIGSPASGTTVSGQVNVSVNATDNVGVSRVELRVNGNTLATDTSAPYAFTWDSTKLANGSHTLSAYAVDAAGNASLSADVSVNVSNASSVAADTTPPVIALLSPANGAVVSGSVNVSASASDNSGAAGISQRLYIDGKLAASATGASLSYSWNTRKAGAGTHTLQVVAKDAAGNSSTTSIKVSR